MVDQNKYLIGRLRPGVLIDAAHLLRSGGCLPVVALYNQTVRTGRSRKRTTVTRQLLPGILFLPEDQRPLAQAALSPINQQITWIKDPLNGGSYALCTADDIRPLFTWISNRNRPKDIYVPEQRPHIGQMVEITTGPMEGWQGILNDYQPSTDMATVIINDQNGMKLKIPGDLLRIAK